jgi:putative transposase
VFSTPKRDNLSFFAKAASYSLFSAGMVIKLMQSRLKVLQRKATSKQKRSKNWEKSQVAVAKLHCHITNRLKCFYFHNIHKFCDKNKGAGG